MSARDALTHSVRVYTRPGSVAKALDKYERRGERALRRGQRTVNRETNGLRRDAGDVLERIKRLA